MHVFNLLLTSLSNLENELCFAVSRSTTVNQGGSSSPACQPPDDNYCTRLCQTKDAYCADEKTCVCHPGGLPPVVNQRGSSSPACQPPNDNYCTRLCQTKDAYCVDEKTCVCHPGGLPPVVSHPNQPTYNNRLFVCDPVSCRGVCAPKVGQCNEDGECQCNPVVPKAIP